MAEFCRIHGTLNGIRRGKGIFLYELIIGIVCLPFLLFFLYKAQRSGVRPSVGVILSFFVGVAAFAFPFFLQRGLLLLWIILTGGIIFLPFLKREPKLKQEAVFKEKTLLQQEQLERQRTDPERNEKQKQEAFHGHHGQGLMLNQDQGYRAQADLRPQEDPLQQVDLLKRADLLRVEDLPKEHFTQGDQSHQTGRLTAKQTLGGTVQAEASATPEPETCADLEPDRCEPKHDRGKPEFEARMPDPDVEQFEPELSLEELLEKGFQAKAQENYPEAAQAFFTALNHWPSYDIAYYLIIDCYWLWKSPPRLENGLGELRPFIERFRAEAPEDWCNRLEQWLQENEIRL